MCPRVLLRKELEFEVPFLLPMLTLLAAVSVMSSDITTSSRALEVFKLQCPSHDLAAQG